MSKISPDSVASLLLLPDVLNETRKPKSLQSSFSANRVFVALVCFVFILVPDCKSERRRRGSRAPRWRNALCPAPGTDPRFLRLCLYPTIQSIHHTSNPSLCRQARRVLQLLSQCGVKSPQKEHTDGKLKIISPPKLLYFLIKLLVNSKHVGLKHKPKENVSDISWSGRRAVLSDTRKLGDFSGQYLNKTQTPGCQS